MDAFQRALVDERLCIQQCPETIKGLGVFAKQDLSKGLRLFVETPMFAYESKEDALRNIVHDFAMLPFDEQILFIRLFAGVIDTVPIIRKLNHDIGYAVATPERLRQIAQHNCIEGQGTGCVIQFFCSHLNHR